MALELRCFECMYFPVGFLSSAWVFWYLLGEGVSMAVVLGNTNSP